MPLNKAAVSTLAMKVFIVGKCEIESSDERSD
jgi:hypothetical protein